MSDKETEFFKAIKTIREFLYSKKPNMEQRLEIASACNHLYSINERT